MSTQYIDYPDSGSSGGSGSIPTYANLAAFPASPADGAQGIALDTHTVYVYSAAATAWKAVATPGDVLSVGALDANAATSSGLSINNNALSLQSADATHPGVVNTAPQTFAGAKTFSGAISASNLSGTNTGDQTITLTGDATGSGSGSFAVTVTKTGGVAFAASATTDTTNASNITSGTLPVGQLPATVALTGANNTFTTYQTFNYAGTASHGALVFTGAPYAAGTATTNKPQVLLEDAATSTGWSTSGTYLGVNSASTFAGNLLDLQKNGASKFSVSSAGAVTQGSDLTVSVSGSTTTTPRVIGGSSLSTGNAMRWQFGDAANCVQNAFNDRMQLVSYWGLEIYGGRQIAATTPQGFATGLTTDIALNVYGSVAANPILGVTAAASQSGALQEWRNSSGTPLSSVTSAGVFTGSGSGLTSLNASNLSSGTISPTRLTAPTVQKFTSGSGTYTTPTSPAPLFLRVRMVGGGGGGSGSGTAGSSTGGTGGNTTFGTTLLVANGGTGGAFSAGTPSSAAGGTASLGTGPIGIALTGGSGGAGTYGNGAATSGTVPGAPGGNSSLGGASGGAGSAAAANSGAGGGGGNGPGGNVASVQAGNGGGAGGFVDAIITSPSATYAYAVGSAGGAGVANTSGNAGGPGGSGILIVEEYYC